MTIPPFDPVLDQAALPAAEARVAQQPGLLPALLAEVPKKVALMSAAPRQLLDFSFSQFKRSLHSQTAAAQLVQVQRFNEWLSELEARVAEWSSAQNAEEQAQIAADAAARAPALAAEAAAAAQRTLQHILGKCPVAMSRNKIVIANAGALNGEDRLQLRENRAAIAAALAMREEF